jgi:hypothetical protein
MADLRLDNTGDIEISNFSFGLTTDTTDAIIQKLRIKLRWFLGEFFLDISLGIPFIEKVLVKAPNLSDIDFIFKSEILSVVGVSQILNYNTEFNTSLRKYTVNFQALLDDGTTITLSEEI